MSKRWLAGAGLVLGLILVVFIVGYYFSSSVTGFGLFDKFSFKAASNNKNSNFNYEDLNYKEIVNMEKSSALNGLAALKSKINKLRSSLAVFSDSDDELKKLSEAEAILDSYISQLVDDKNIYKTANIMQVLSHDTRLDNLIGSVENKVNSIYYFDKLANDINQLEVLLKKNKKSVSPALIQEVSAFASEVKSLNTKVQQAVTNRNLDLAVFYLQEFYTNPKKVLMSDISKKLAAIKSKNKNFIITTDHVVQEMLLLNVIVPSKQKVTSTKREVAHLNKVTGKLVYQDRSCPYELPPAGEVSVLVLDVFWANRGEIVGESGSASINNQINYANSFLRDNSFDRIVPRIALEELYDHSTSRSLTIDMPTDREDAAIFALNYYDIYYETIYAWESQYHTVAVYPSQYTTGGYNLGWFAYSSREESSGFPPRTLAISLGGTGHALLHELGHQWNSGHDNALYCALDNEEVEYTIYRELGVCYEDEYGNPFSRMGQNNGGYSISFRESKDWLWLLHVEDAGTYSIAPVNRASHSSRLPGGIKIHLPPDNAPYDYMYLEYIKPEGYNMGLRDFLPTSGGLIVTLVDEEAVSSCSDNAVPKSIFIDTTPGSLDTIDGLIEEGREWCNLDLRKCIRWEERDGTARVSIEFLQPIPPALRELGERINIDDSDEDVVEGGYEPECIFDYDCPDGMVCVDNRYSRGQSCISEDLAIPNIGVFFGPISLESSCSQSNSTIFIPIIVVDNGLREMEGNYNLNIFGTDWNGRESLVRGYSYNLLDLIGPETSRDLEYFDLDLDYPPGVHSIRAEIQGAGNDGDPTDNFATLSLPCQICSNSMGNLYVERDLTDENFNSVPDACEI